MFRTLVRTINQCNRKDIDFALVDDHMFELCFIDWDSVEDEFRDYIDPIATANLHEWVKSNSNSKDRAVSGQPIFVFDDFSVMITYLSEYAL